MSSASLAGSTTGRSVSWYAWAGLMPVWTIVGSISPASGVDTV